MGLGWIWRASDSLAAQAAGWDRLVTAGLLAACALLYGGLTLPIIRTSQLVIFSDELSLVGVVTVLWQEDEFFLSIVVLVFSLVFPAIKLGATFALWRWAPVGAPRFGRLLAVVEFLGKWSLADVLIVALAIVVIKSSRLMDATIGIGIYPFTASIAVTAVIVARLKHLARARSSHFQ